MNFEKEKKLAQKNGLRRKRFVRNRNNHD